MLVQKLSLVLLLVIPIVTAGKPDVEQTAEISEAATSIAGLMVNESAPTPAEAVNDSGKGPESALEDTDAFKQAILTEPGLHEINGTTLSLLLEEVRKRDDLFLGVFFYARWCPFSQQLFPLVRTLPELFPQFPLVAVEERAVKPSALSRYGVYSFPLFFIYSKNHRSKFTGSRELETLVEMITTTTGYNPVARPKTDHCEANLALFDRLSTPEVDSGSQMCPDLTAYHHRAVQEETCPYRWTFQPSIWASNNLYLMLASSFLALRFLFFLIREGWGWLKQGQITGQQIQ
ncbi:Thioredoxin superfamily protein [Klebsormidium nitens]|uniref:Thioredoxin superfamily protein n=1 Tax=Klebsormidium nitens TaxID=105231 RepID=A0A1Y1IDG6_KLENI|nr:Thioredoxin superfamily protein [Klebsormidium nitens]|eukprot:GAQ86757.1 Thioredoxin superfamily protein [Klebsormidium nitens]